MLFEKKDNAAPEPANNELFKATREIAATFQENDLKFETKRVNGMSALETGVKGKNIGSIKVVFASTDNDNDVAVRSFNIVPKVPEEKKAAILETINRLNHKYRYAKFVLNNDSAIGAEYDIPVKSEKVGEIAMEIFVRFAKIIDEAYPELMKALWS